MEEMEKGKMQSRKFLVWITWLIITIAVIAFCTIVMFCTHSIVESMTSLIEKTLGWFFAVSMMYLGANAGQKVGLAVSEAIAKNKEGEQE